MKRILLAMLIGLLAVAMAACSGGSTNTSPQPSGGSNDSSGASESGNKEPVQELKPKEEVTLVYYTPTARTEEQFREEYGDAIEKGMPHVKIEFIPAGSGTTIPELLTAGQTIDIFYYSSGQIYSHLIEYGLEYDLTELINKYNYDLSRLEPTTIEFQQKVADGGIYGLPVWTATAGLFYNKDIFDKFAVPYPEDGMTWDEIYDLAVQLTRVEDGVQYYGYVTSFNHQGLTNQLSLSPIDPETHQAIFDNDAWKRFYESVIRFYQIDGYNLDREKMNVTLQRQWFEKDQIVAMYTNFTGGVPPVEMNWDVVSVPFYDENPGMGAQSYTNYHTVASLSEKKDEAFEVLMYLTSDEFQMDFTRRMPRATILNNDEIRAAYGADLENFKGKNVAAMIPAQRAAPHHLTKYDAIARKHMTEAFNVAVLGEKDLNTALREAVEATNQEIQAAKASQ